MQSSRLCAVNVETMGGRRSRHWCGLGLVRETKTVVTPDDYQAGGALQFFFLVHAASSRVLVLLCCLAAPVILSPVLHLNI